MTSVKWICTLFAVASALAIPISHWYSLSVWWDPPPLQEGGRTWYSTRELCVTGGRLHVMRYTNQRGRDWPVMSHILIYRLVRPLAWMPYEGGPEQHGRAYRFALWPGAVGAAFPAGILWFIGSWVAMRRRAGACARCGYSRAGLEYLAKCPECGTSSTRG